MLLLDKEYLNAIAWAANKLGRRGDKVSRVTIKNETVTIICWNKKYGYFDQAYSLESLLRDYMCRDT